MKTTAGDIHTGVDDIIEVIERLRAKRITGAGRIMHYRYNSYITLCILIHPFTDPLPSYVYTSRYIYPVNIE